MGTGHMGVTAENVAREHDISRRRRDEFALESQRRAANAIAQGYFNEQIVPVEIKTRKGMVAFDTDEHPKTTDLDKLAGLKPAFQKDGTVTAGNASGINDGAGASSCAGRCGEGCGANAAVPACWAMPFAGVRPEVMGIGRSRRSALLARTGLKIGDFDVIESNEALPRRRWR